MLLKSHLTVVTLLLPVAACSKSQPDAPGAAPAPTTADFSAAQAAEYQQLPAKVMIGVRSDGSTMGMRIPAANDLRDENAALAAYEAGIGVTPVDPNQGQASDHAPASQTWAPVTPQGNFTNYAPQAYSQKNAGYSYSYGLSAQFSILGFTFFIYDRPPCIPLFCAPTSYGGGGTGPAVSGTGNGDTDYDSELAKAFRQYGVYAVADTEYYTGSAEKVELGRRLFHDPMLSASNAVACASCHIATHGTTTVVALPPSGYVLAGQKSRGFGPADLLSRNPPALYNLGHKSFTTMFWDSRVAASPSTVNDYITQAGALTPAGLDTALAAQALFPLATGAEMAGCSAYVGGTQQSRPFTDIWSDILKRVLADQSYLAQFTVAFPEAGGQFGIQHLANAIATFEAVHWRADKSPFDAYVRGNQAALSPNQKRGAWYFYGKGGCATCHTGPFQTDHLHHSVAVPQWGPGAGDGSMKWEDFGLGRQTGKAADRYKFRTPSLRNVTVTGPWGHDGAYSSLRDFVGHYSNPKAAFDRWDAKQVILPGGYPLNNTMLGAWNEDASRTAIKAANEFSGNNLNGDEVNAITDFLTTLTDHEATQR